MSAASTTASEIGLSQVICVTADKQRIHVDIDVLRLSHVFDQMLRDIRLEELEDLVFPLVNVHSRVFRKVVAWCEEHKGQPEPIVEKDPITQEYRWFALSVFDRGLFNVPVPELIDLINAAKFLEIPGLYHLGCQAIAALIQGKGPVEVRQTLRQWANLSVGDYAEIRDRNPWLDPRTVVHDTRGEVRIPLDIANDVLIDVFEKLTRADLEGLQMVNAQFRDVIRGEILKEQGPRRQLREVVLGKKLRSRHFVRLLGGARIVCQDFASLDKRIESCAVEKLVFDSEERYADEVFYSLLPSKSVWKNASVIASPRNFSSKKMFKFAFTELLFCKEVVLQEPKPARFIPDSLLQLPAILHCNSLSIGYLPGFRLELRRMWFSLQAADVVAWLKHERPKEWSGEPKQLVIAGHAISGGFMNLVHALSRAFSVALRPDPYTVRIRMLRLVELIIDERLNCATEECLGIRVEGGGGATAACYVVVERKAFTLY